MAEGYGLAGQIDGYLKSKGSPLSGMGQTFVATGKKYGVDPRLVVGISGAESSFGKHLFAPYNAWGWMSGDSYGSWQQSINAVTKGLASGYISQGLTTPATIVGKYAPGSAGNDEGTWSSNVATFMRELGAAPTTSVAKSVVKPPPTAKVPTGAELVDVAKNLPKRVKPSTSGLQGALLGNLGLIAQRGHASGQGLLDSVLQGTLQDRQTDAANQAQLDAYRAALAAAQGQSAPPATTQPTPALMPPPTPAPTPSSGPVNVNKWARLGSGADRSGVRTNQSVLDAVARIGKVNGEQLTISTGTNHNQFVVNTNRESQHWQGNAADIAYGHGTGPDNVDPALTRLGRSALIAAGMPAKEAAKQFGGVFNVGGWNILFNTGVGGNHYNHLHVGV